MIGPLRVVQKQDKKVLVGEGCRPVGDGIEQAQPGLLRRQSRSTQRAKCRLQRWEECPKHPRTGANFALDCRGVASTEPRSECLDEKQVGRYPFGVGRASAQDRRARGAGNLVDQLGLIDARLTGMQDERCFPGGGSFGGVVYDGKASLSPGQSTGPGWNSGFHDDDCAWRNPGP